MSFPSILSHFLNKFNKIDNTGALMIDSIYHMKSKLLKKSHNGHKNVNILPPFMRPYNECHYVLLYN